MNFHFKFKQFFQAQLLTECIDNRYIVCETPHMVLCFVYFLIVQPASFFCHLT